MHKSTTNHGEPAHNKINVIEFDFKGPDVIKTHESNVRNVVQIKRGAQCRLKEPNRSSSAEWVWLCRQYTNVTPASLLRCFFAVMKLEETWRKSEPNNG